MRILLLVPVWFQTPEQHQGKVTTNNNAKLNKVGNDQKPRKEAEVSSGHPYQDRAQEERLKVHIHLIFDTANVSEQCMGYAGFCFHLRMPSYSQ